MAWANTGEKLK